MGESKFTGSVGQMFLMKLLLILIAIPSMFTLGILGAWYTMHFQRWIASNTYIDGRQLRFDGRTMEFWVQRLIWMILTVVTLFIYAIFFLAVRKIQWFTARTHVADAPAM